MKDRDRDSRGPSHLGRPINVLAAVEMEGKRGKGFDDIDDDDDDDDDEGIVFENADICVVERDTARGTELRGAAVHIFSFRPSLATIRLRIDIGGSSSSRLLASVH